MTSLSNTSKEFKAVFMLLFTRELIRHSKINDISKLETIIKKRILPPKKKEFISVEGYGEMMPSMMYQEMPMPAPMSKAPLIFPSRQPTPKIQFKPAPANVKPMQQIFPQKQTQIQPGMQIPSQKGKIPETQLPPQLQHIKPVPSNVQLDLGKITQIIQNPEFLSLECNGPEEPLNFKTSQGTRMINMKLTKEEIADILKKFSDFTKIPLNEGIFKVAAGNMIISAVVSDVVGSRFIIRKMQQQPQNPNYSITRRY